MAFFLIQYTPGPAWRKGESVYQQDLQAHGQYMQDLMERGALVLGGPFTDDSGGAAVVEAGSKGEAEEVLKRDPAVISGVFSAVLRPWHVVFHAPNEHRKDLKHR